MVHVRGAMTEQRRRKDVYLSRCLVLHAPKLCLQRIFFPPFEVACTYCSTVRETSFVPLAVTTCNNNSHGCRETLSLSICIRMDCTCTACSSSEWRRLYLIYYCRLHLDEDHMLYTTLDSSGIPIKRWTVAGKSKKLTIRKVRVSISSVVHVYISAT